MADRDTPRIFNCSPSFDSWLRRYNAGRSLRRTRSPVTPKTTKRQGAISDFGIRTSPIKMLDPFMASHLQPRRPPGWVGATLLCAFRRPALLRLHYRDPETRPSYSVKNSVPRRVFAQGSFVWFVFLLRESV